MKNADLKKLETEYAERILAECQSDDPESDHGKRDELLTEFLNKAGFTELAAASDTVEGDRFWYA